MSDYTPDDRYPSDDRPQSDPYTSVPYPGSVPPPVYTDPEEAGYAPAYSNPAGPASFSPQDYINNRNDDYTGYTRAFSDAPEMYDDVVPYGGAAYPPPDRSGMAGTGAGYDTPYDPEGYGDTEPGPGDTAYYYNAPESGGAVPPPAYTDIPVSGDTIIAPAFSDAAAQAPYSPQDYISNRPDAVDPYKDEDSEEYYLTREAEEYDEEEERRRIKRERSLFKERRRKPSFVLAVIVHSLRLLLLVILLAGLSGAGAVVGVARAYVDSAPELELTVLEHQAQTSVIYDRNDNYICDYKSTENRKMVSITTMPLYLQYAFVAVEDARFYEHKGVDVKRIAGAFFANFTTGSNQGGSTITQQLIKNTLLSPEQSYKRKIQEAYLAMQLETAYTKDEILECYLNTIYLGEDYYGVQTASVGYFGKEDLSSLTLRECAMLAGITRSPSYYNPRRNFYTRVSDQTDYAAITNNRTDYVLLCMYENGLITYEEYTGALDPSAAHVRESTGEDHLYPYPHYVEYAIRDAIQIMLKLNGLENNATNRSRMDRELRTGGYEIRLAVDPEIQSTVQRALQEFDYPSMRDPKDKVYKARNSDGTYTEIVQPQAAAVVMDYRTGEVKAIVGSRTPPTQRKTLNRATDMNMPVGSAIKPIGVYAPAIERGQSPASVAYNMPLPLPGWKNDEGKDSWPQNYGGSEYRGPETLRTAMKYSDNTAAAYTLLTYSSVSISADYLRKLGVSDAHINATPFGLSLGSSGITPFEMAAAYSCLGNGGVYQTPITVLRIDQRTEDGSMKQVWEKGQRTTRRVFAASTAWLIIDMMKDVVSEGTGTQAKIKGQTVAGKTGTNSDQKGVFFVGLTGWYCGAVWVGHDNYKSLSSNATGGKTAAKLWQSFMKEIHSGLDNRDIFTGSASDYGLVKVKTCVVSGQLATEQCEHARYGTVTDWWRDGTQPVIPCQLHQKVYVCNESGLPASQTCTNVSEKSMLILPYGHPLTKYQGTQYEQVLTDYLGDSARFRFTAEGYAVDTCPGHQGYQGYQEERSYQNYQGYAEYREDYNTPVQSAYSGIRNDAENLLFSAGGLLTSMNPSSPSYNSLLSATENLRYALETNASDDRLIEAMNSLYQAMSNIR